MGAITTFSVLAGIQSEEERIARGLRQRDPDMLDALIEQYRHRLMRYLLHVLGNRVVAEDLFQETWIRVLERGAQYDGQTRFVAWLLAIAHNLAIDYLRKKKRAGLQELDAEPEDGAPMWEPASCDPSPYEIAAANERAQTVAEAMSRVPALFREVLVLRFQEQMKLEEIASLTGVPLATVKSRLYRGVQSLRPALIGKLG
jgi:RNA polymerase sigma-70 factor (ECF subfamily)